MPFLGEVIVLSIITLYYVLPNDCDSNKLKIACDTFDVIRRSCVNLPGGGRNTNLLNKSKKLKTKQTQKKQTKSKPIYDENETLENDIFTKRLSISKTKNPTNKSNKNTAKTKKASTSRKDKIPNEDETVKSLINQIMTEPVDNADKIFDDDEIKAALSRSIVERIDSSKYTQEMMVSYISSKTITNDIYDLYARFKHHLKNNEKLSKTDKKPIPNDIKEALLKLKQPAPKSKRSQDSSNNDDEKPKTDDALLNKYFIDNKIIGSCGLNFCISLSFCNI